MSTCNELFTVVHECIHKVLLEKLNAVQIQYINPNVRQEFLPNSSSAKLG